MLLELAERLRCPGPHVASPMIVVAERVNGRVLERGVAGCPVCHREAQLLAGVVRFDVGGPVHASDTIALAPTEERLDRTIALLGLAEPGGTVMLGGRYRVLAPALAARLDLHVVLWEPLENEADGERISGARGAGPAVPFSDHTFRAAAVDETVGEALHDIARTLVPSGRIIAPASVSPARGTRELARDSEEWVAEPAGRFVPLVRRH